MIVVYHISYQKQKLGVILLALIMIIPQNQMHVW